MVTPITAAIASLTLPRLGFHGFRPGINVAMSTTSPATRLHKPVFFSTDRDTTPLAISLAP